MVAHSRGRQWAEAGLEVDNARASGAHLEARPFQIESDFRMTGDQPQAVTRLSSGVRDGLAQQTLLGVTGSGKTFTMANIVQEVQRPTLVMAHNKTLAAQLANEFKEFFPHNAVEYFVSYYDYYQPEAYVPHSDTYIEKDSSVNEELDKLRLSATTSLLTRRDVLIVASVSCIYGLGDPKTTSTSWLVSKWVTFGTGANWYASWWTCNMSATIWTWPGANSEYAEILSSWCPPTRKRRCESSFLAMK